MNARPSRWAPSAPSSGRRSIITISYEIPPQSVCLRSAGSARLACPEPCRREGHRSIGQFQTDALPFFDTPGLMGHSVLRVPILPPATGFPPVPKSLNRPPCQVHEGSYDVNIDGPHAPSAANAPLGLGRDSGRAVAGRRGNAGPPAGGCPGAACRATSTAAVSHRGGRQ